MTEKIISLVGKKLEELHMNVYDAFFTTEEGNTYLRIILDSDDTIDLNRIVEASKIINPIIDEADLMEENSILDICSREKGDDCCER